MVLELILESNAIVFHGIDYEGDNLEVIASYKFYWERNAIITKTYAIKYFDGNLVPFSVTFSNTNKRNLWGYATPTEKKVLWIFYALRVGPENAYDPFVDSFFAKQSKSTDLDSWRRVFVNKGTVEDNNRFSRMPFVLFAFAEP